jgi:Tfp pilus assembly protein PilX
MRKPANRRRSPWASRRSIFRRLRREESGQSLVLVTMIGVMATLMMTTATTALTTQIRPARASVDSGEATAAAQAGLESFLSWVNTNCPPTSGYLCSALATGITNKSGITDPANQKGVGITGGDGAASTESYWWTVTYAVSGFARVKSVGQVPTNKTSPKYLTKTLIADVNAIPSFNNFQYYTKYETYSSEFIDNFYRARTVQVTGSVSESGTSLSTSGKPGSLSWAGVCAYDASTNPSCDQNHSTNICDDLYYPSSNGPGRGTSTAWNNGTRRPSSATQNTMGTDSSFAYYAENGTFTPTTGSPMSVTHNDDCDSSMEPNMVMNGPVYSQDAYLIDRGKDTGNSKNSMPNFGGAAFTVWNGTINGTQQAVGANGGYDRAYTGTDGQAQLTNSYPSDASGNQTFPIYESNALELPADASDSLPLAQCVYTGPTRIVLSGTTAYITSPLTPAGSSACYQSTGSFANVNTLDSKGQSTTDVSGGVINAAVPLSRTLIYVKNPDSTVQPNTATVSSPVFNTATNLTVPATSYANSLTGTWTDDATYLASSACPSPANVAKRRNFDCETGKSTPTKEDVFTNVKAAADTALKTPGVTAATLTTAIQGQLSTTSQTAGTTVGSVWYTVSVAAASPTTASVTPGAGTPADPFLQTKTGLGYTTTTYKYTPTISRLVCTAVKKGACSSNTTTTIVSGALTRNSSTANGTPLNSSQNFPWFGKQPGDTGYDSTKTYTDMNNDVTQYSHGYGDVYVEGTTNANVSLVAEHDIVVTNDLNYGSSVNLNTTSYGLALVADHNVRIYRPMTCSYDGALGGTSAGFCPNDYSGVYTDNLTWPVANNYPSNMYKPDNAPSITNGGSGTIYAAIFTLRGSFMADNFYRGAIGNGITVYGGLYQYHRGATSLPYQGRPYQGSTTKMPGISVTYNYDNLRAGQAVNGGLRVPYIPPPDGRLTNNTWNIISVSTAP